MEILSLLIQWIQLQKSLAEQTRLAKLPEFVIRIGNVIDTFVGLETFID